MRFSYLCITEMLNTNIGIVDFVLTDYPVCVDKLKQSWTITVPI